jgi:hypothetical protein
VELARQWRVPAERIIYDMAGIGRSFGSYLASHGLAGAVGYFGAGRGGKRHVNCHTPTPPTPHAPRPTFCSGIPEWPNLRQKLAALQSPAMEIQEAQVKQLVEPKEALAARLHRSPDLLDALLTTFSYLEES